MTIQSKFRREGRGGFCGLIGREDGAICAVSEEFDAVFKALKLLGRHKHFHQGWTFLVTWREAKQMVLLEHGKHGFNGFQRTGLKIIDYLLSM